MPPSPMSFRNRRKLAAKALVVTAALTAGGSCTTLPTECDVVSIGAGWAGVYFAYRMATSGRNVCVFEATHRVGGRTYSHTLQAGSPPENFTLDVGAYRFSPDMHLPADLILDVLKLPTACYEPDCAPANKDFPKPFIFNYTAPLLRIVDEHKQPAGYVRAIEGMVREIESRGGKLYLGAQLTDIEAAPTGVRLHFAEQVVMTNQTLLNLPRPALLALPSLRARTPARTQKAQECVKFDLPTRVFPPGSLDLGHSLTKAYAFYEEAWWHTKLNMTEGQLPENAFEPIRTSQGIPIGIHFNDGPVHCDAPQKNCRGFLEVYYSTVVEDFFEDLRPSDKEPLGVLTEAADAEGKLKKLHAAVMEVTGEAFKQKGLAPPSEPPSMLVVGVWARGPTATGYTAPTKVYYSADPSTPGGPDPLDKACGVAGLTEGEYRESVMMPVSDKRILVANNDWVALSTERMFGDWAEESLLQAERGLRRLGLPRPAWLNATYYEAQVASYAGAMVTEVVV